MSNNLQAPWSLKDLALIFALYIAAFSFLFLISNFLFLNSFTSIPLAFFIQWLIFLTPILLLTNKKYHLKPTHFALNPIPAKTAIKQALAAYFAYILIVLTITTIKQKYHLPIPGFGEQQLFENPDDLQKNTSLLLLIITFIGPILEEIFFRGFLLRTIAKKIPPIIASILIAITFSALHYPWQSFSQILIIGLILNYLTLKNNSLIPGITFHILNNTIAFAIITTHL